MKRWLLISVPVVAALVALFAIMHANGIDDDQLFSDDPGKSAQDPEALLKKQEAYHRRLARDERMRNEKNQKWHNEGYKGQLVPVLCYHRIDAGARDHYYVSRAEFEWQMKYLAEHCNVVSTGQLVDHIRWKKGLSAKRVELPERAVVIQFDDNYKSVYDEAYPILKKYKLPWTFFLYKHHHSPNPDARHAAMAKAGVDLQAHSMTHPWFHQVGKRQTLNEYVKEMHWQIGGCKQWVESLTQRPCRYMAYPFGTYSDLAIRMCNLYGFEAMFAADGGYATAESSLAAIERILVSKGWSRGYFVQIVTGKSKWRKVFKPGQLLKDERITRLAATPDKRFM